jgi:tRNA pseudouridine55 synthase
MDGFLVVDKEKGFTSFDVCNKIKHKFYNSHVGHTGTLDPNATGVLVVAVGKACKTLNLMEEKDKEYLCEIEFGRSYDTIDPTGKLLSESDKEVKIENIEKAIDKLKLATTQLPPKFSALKVNGKRAYDLARSGKEFELEKRPIKIFDISVASPLTKKDNCYYISIKLKVSKGFYVRSFVRDLAKMLNVDANMFNLCRLSSGVFNIDKAKKLDELTEADFISVSDAFSYLPRVEFRPYLLKMIQNGSPLDERNCKIETPFVAVIDSKEIALYNITKEKYKYRFEALL